METTIYNPDGDTRVTLIQTSGEVAPGASGADRLRGLLHGLVDGGDRFLVVDLSDSEAVDERALAEMLAVLARARLAGGDLVFVVQPGEVLHDLRTIGATGLTLVLEFLDQAVDQMVMKASEADD